MAALAGQDPHFSKAMHSWSQSLSDQWALHRIGIQSEYDFKNEVVVAVIDSGLDFYHPDLPRERVWHNSKERLNGIDDDANGYIDDYYGWDFVNEDNIPWDDLGHGTHVAGLVAAQSGNSYGIAGICPTARIMPLKAMNFAGEGRTDAVLRAIFYAVQNGADIINLSLGGRDRNALEDRAIQYAADQGVLVVIAAGNEQTDVGPISMAGASGAITVGATDEKDKVADFSNYGQGVDIVAPGVDILSLRARRTDIAAQTSMEGYTPGSAFVGELSSLYRASGTSFSAPLVSGVAALLLARDPDLSVAQLRRVLLHSAADVEVPGLDPVSGYGRLDAAAALSADPEFFLEAYIEGVQPDVRKGKPIAKVLGSVDADKFRSAELFIGKGEGPSKWEPVDARIRRAVDSGVLAEIPAQAFAGAPVWTVRLVAKHANGKTREHRFLLRLG